MMIEMYDDLFLVRSMLLLPLGHECRVKSSPSSYSKHRIVYSHSFL
jgi:hypothetical protein